MQPITIHDTRNASPESAALLAGVETQLGFIPNVFAALAGSTPALKAFLDLNARFSETSLSGIEREVVQLVASAENGCGYCVAGHTVFACDQRMDEDVLRALRSSTPLPDPKLEALARFTRGLVRRRGHDCGSELEDFVAAGYSPANALEVLVGISVKTMSNLASNAFAIPLDDAFGGCAWSPGEGSREIGSRVA